MPSNVQELDSRPEAKNLIGIYSSLCGISTDNSIQQFSGKNFSQFKEILSQILIEKIIPISSEIKKLLNERDYLTKILSEGCKKADEIASKKIKKIHEILGF